MPSLAPPDALFWQSRPTRLTARGKAECLPSKGPSDRPQGQGHVVAKSPRGTRRTSGGTVARLWRERTAAEAAERSLLYVAATRAKKELTILSFGTASPFLA